MSTSRVCIIGHVIVDVSLASVNSELKLRLGGIIHAARCLWAMEIPYSVAYIAPAYLDEQVASFLLAHGCDTVQKIGNVTGAPSVFLINEIKEVGDQGYEYLLRDESKITYDSIQLEQLSKSNFDDYLIIGGDFDYLSIGASLNGRVHIDVANNLRELVDLDIAERKFDTILLSTSSEIFQKEFENMDQFKAKFQNFCNHLVVKENRGGSRAYDFNFDRLINVPAQATTVSHSVGVGDAYSAVVAATSKVIDFEDRLTQAAWIATAYAKTTFPDDLKRDIGRVLNVPISSLRSLGGISLPWEVRHLINIYIAAPDFDHVDTREIDLLASSLKYHNFTPRRPILENGQMPLGAERHVRGKIFDDDMKLLGVCQVVIAVLLYNDPGTLIEIGLAAAQCKPVLVYDPHRIAGNCMLTELPDLVSDDLDEIMSTLFQLCSKISNL